MTFKHSIYHTAPVLPVSHMPVLLERRDVCGHEYKLIKSAFSDRTVGQSDMSNMYGVKTAAVYAVLLSFSIIPQ